MQAVARAPTHVSLCAGGLALHARVWPGRAPGAPMVLLLHATSFCGGTWEPVWRPAERFAAAAVAPDARGHGASAAPESPAAYAWTHLVDDAVAWIDAIPERIGLPHDGVVVVGHSSGGAAALVAAARRPAQVRGVLAVEPVLFDAPPAGADVDSYAGSRFMAAQARRRRGRFASVDEARARLSSRPPYAGFAAESLAAFFSCGLAAEPTGGVSLRCTPEVEAACYDGAAALDLWASAGRIVCPVRVVAGAQSFLPASLLERLKERIPGMDLVTLAGGTHFVALEEPAAVGETLAGFLRQVTPVHVA